MGRPSGRQSCKCSCGIISGSGCHRRVADMRCSWMQITLHNCTMPFAHCTLHNAYRTMHIKHYRLQTMNFVSSTLMHITHCVIHALHIGVFGVLDFAKNEQLKLPFAHYTMLQILFCNCTFCLQFAMEGVHHVIQHCRHIPQKVSQKLLAAKYHTYRQIRHSCHGW